MPRAARPRQQNLKNLLPPAGFNYPPEPFVFPHGHDSFAVLGAMAASIEHTGLVYPAMVDTMLEDIFVQSRTRGNDLKNMEIQQFWTMIKHQVLWSRSDPRITVDIVERLVDYLVQARLRGQRWRNVAVNSIPGKTAVAIDQWLGFLGEHHPALVPLTGEGSDDDIDDDDDGTGDSNGLGFGGEVGAEVEHDGGNATNTIDRYADEEFNGFDPEASLVNWQPDQ